VPRKSLVVICIVGSLLGAIGPSAAGAVEPSLTLTTAADPAESITTQIIAKGTSNNNRTRLSITLKSTGGQGCGANVSADSGSSLIEPPAVEEVAFSKSFNHEFTSAGSYLLCGWLNDDAQTGSPVVATASLTFAVRPPRLALSISAPSTVQTEQTFQIVTTAQAEVSRNVTEYVLSSTGRGCPANGSAAGTTSGLGSIYFRGFNSSWNVSGGPFSESVNYSLRSAGQYLICGYMQYPSSQSPPEITASTPITVVSPPSPCVVPTLTSVTKRTSAEQALAASGCTVGKVRLLANRRIRAGYVIGFSASAGTHLPPGTAVAIAVSTGPPCIVPRVSAGTALSIVKQRLAANHCSVGKLSMVHSRRYRRGRVLRLGARTGQVLASHTAVTVVVSRGNRR
jgi:hypothetical protein